VSYIEYMLLFLFQVRLLFNLLSVYVQGFTKHQPAFSGMSA